MIAGYRVSSGNPLVSALVDMLGDHPNGVTTADVVARLQVGVEHARRVVGTAEAEGLVKRIYRGRAGALVVAPEQFDRLHAEHTERTQEKRRRYGRDLYHVRRAAGVIDTHNRLVDPPDWPVEQRMVPAAGAPRLEVCAPRSVFELAGVSL